MSLAGASVVVSVYVDVDWVGEVAAEFLGLLLRERVSCDDYLKISHCCGV